MSGPGRPGALPENVLKLAYERLSRFSMYGSLRQFKEIQSRMENHLRDVR